MEVGDLRESPDGGIYLLVREGKLWHGGRSFYILALHTTAVDDECFVQGEVEPASAAWLDKWTLPLP